MVTVDGLARELRRRLAGEYGEGEAKAMVRLIFQSLKGWNATEQIIHGDMPVSEGFIKRVDGILRRLENHEPLQYILGDAYFHGLTLKVTPAVLIPRPETAELVDLIVDEAEGKSDLQVLDLGTGSGSIAVALARSLRFPDITALDISEDALDVAKENARICGVKINFIQADFHKWVPKPEMMDIVVSNPPYVLESERKEMDRNVLDYEPATALFVPDDDPLVAYRSVVRIARQGLKEGGRLYLEVNPICAAELKDYIANEGFGNVSIINDAQGKKRFITATYGES